MLFLFIFLLFSFTLLTDSCFNNKDIEIVSSMIEYLWVKEYVLVSKLCGAEIIIPKLKYLSKKNILGIYLNFENFVNLFENKFLNLRTMIFIKVENNMELEIIRNIFKEKVL